MTHLYLKYDKNQLWIIMFDDQDSYQSDRLFDEYMNVEMIDSTFASDDGALSPGRTMSYTSKIIGITQVTKNGFINTILS